MGRFGDAWRSYVPPTTRGGTGETPPAAPPRGPRPRKYRNEPIVQDGLAFDSTLEADTWRDLQLRQAAGEIRDLGRQRSFPLVVNGDEICVYRADFVWYDGERLVVADAKGLATREFKFKAKLFRALMGFEITILKKG